jgi:hypothetical protein
MELLKAMQETMDANQAMADANLNKTAAKMDVNMKADQEERKVEMKTNME